jgi:hypothetical protein
MVVLVDTTAKHFTLGDVTTDKAYSSQGNASVVAKHGGTPYIPFKYFMTGQGRKMDHLYAYHHDEFLEHYHRRSNRATTVHMIKSKFGDGCAPRPTRRLRTRSCARSSATTSAA